MHRTAAARYTTDMKGVGRGRKWGGGCCGVSWLAQQVVDEDGGHRFPTTLQYTYMTKVLCLESK